MTDDLTLADLEQDLTEKRLESENTEAEVVDLTPSEQEVRNEGLRPGVEVTYESVAGDRVTDWLPRPESYEPQASDLVTVLEYVGVAPEDLSELEGERVPYDGRIRYDVMRQVLAGERAASTDWDADYRRKKALRMLREGM